MRVLFSLALLIFVCCMMLDAAPRNRPNRKERRSTTADPCISNREKFEVGKKLSGWEKNRCFPTNTVAPSFKRFFFRQANPVTSDTTGFPTGTGSGSPIVTGSPSGTGPETSTGAGSGTPPVTGSETPIDTGSGTPTDTGSGTPTGAGSLTDTESPTGTETHPVTESESSTGSVSQSSPVTESGSPTVTGSLTVTGSEFPTDTGSGSPPATGPGIPPVPGSGSTGDTTGSPTVTGDTTDSSEGPVNLHYHYFFLEDLLDKITGCKDCLTPEPTKTGRTACEPPKKICPSV